MTRTSIRIVSVVALCSAPACVPAALAQSLEPKLADCHVIESAAERLACYDRISGRAQPAAKAQAAIAPAPTPAPAPAAATAPAGPAHVAAAGLKPSAMQEAWGLTPDAPRTGLSYYHPNYILVANHTNHVNNQPFAPIANAAGVPNQQLDHTEAQFQISGKLRVWSTEERQWSLYGAYTQQSYWQVYNGNISRPFRETDYMPEVFGSYAPSGLALGPVDVRVFNAGFTHQSNGRSDPLSRSWNRLFAEAGLEYGNLEVYARAWYRLPEDSEEDDNPDITDYYGHGSITANYTWKENTFQAMIRGNVDQGKGAIQVGWFSPPLLGPIRGYVQVFHGYGASLIDYNWSQTTIGAGIALSDGP